MPARDSIHDIVCTALVKDGWTITHDPYKLPFGDRDVYVDLGAERTVAAEKGQQKIAVEIKTFSGASEVRDLQMAIGQFIFYQYLLHDWEPARELWLAIPEEAYISILGDAAGTDMLHGIGLRLLTVDTTAEEIVRWLS